MLEDPVTEELTFVAHRLNESFDSMKKKSEEGPRSLKDPIFFSMRMITFLGKLIDQHQPSEGVCQHCRVEAPCPLIKDMLSHASGRAFQD